MTPFRRPPGLSALLVRCMLGWLLCVQPLAAAVAPAGAMAAGFGILCSGTSPDAPAPAKFDHAQCCLAGCLTPSALPPAPDPLPMPRAAESGVTPERIPSEIVLPNAGLGPQSPRAPPFAFS